MTSACSTSNGTVTFFASLDNDDNNNIINNNNTGQPVDSTGASANSKWFGMGLKSGGGGPYFVYGVNGSKRFGPSPQILSSADIPSKLRAVIFIPSTMIS